MSLLLVDLWAEKTNKNIFKD